MSLVSSSSSDPLRCILPVVLCVLLASHSFGQDTGHGIAAALINVIQNDTNNTASSVDVSTALSINDFQIRDGSNRGDYDVQIGDGYSDDFVGGIIMACIAQNGRDNGEDLYPGTNFCPPAIDFATTGAVGSYYVSSFNAPAGAEYNINMAAAYFPYSKYPGALVYNSGAINGGVNNTMMGSPGLVLGVNFVDNGGGVSTINLTNLGINSTTDGILLVTHGKNEDNYASSMVNSNNGTWTVYIKDNGTDTSAHEQDPVAFVYIPKTNNFVVSGRFRSDGVPLIYNGATPQFSVTNTAVGTWKLTIPGHSPSTGVLIISAEGGMSQNQDNIVSYEPVSDGWIIQARDLPQSPPTLQTPPGEPVASFVFIPAGATVENISPGEGVSVGSRSPMVQAVISNSGPSSLTAQFYGRPATPNSSGDFEIIALPDTQFYTDSAHGAQPEMFYSQTEWIIANRAARNIVYVPGRGDFVDHGDNNGGTPLNEWKVATNALYRLENPTRTLLAQGIPYGTCVGNHDESPNGDSTGTTTYYNNYFGVNHFQGKTYYAGHYGNNNNNHFDFFSAGGMDFMVLYFQYDTTGNTNLLAWGNAVLSTNHNRRAIIVTHNFGGTSTPLSFSAQGLNIYNMAKYHTNVFMMLAGHVTGQGSRSDTFNGHTIRTFVSDYQGWTNGGNGFLRVITFSPANNQVIFQCFSPVTGEWLTDSKSELFFTYNMDHVATSNAPYALIGTVSNVAPGSIASVQWPNLAYGTTYEWYASVTAPDGSTVSGDTWRFTTAANGVPTANNSLLTIFGDMPTNLTLNATDPNSDSLTYHTNTLPAHGLNINFNSTNGTLTYIPVYGYRGSDKFIWNATDGVGTTPSVSLNMNIVSPPDSNANGLPDWWENKFGLADPNADPDGDGRNNYDEFVANSNPTNGASVLRISSMVRAANGHVTLTWPSSGGVRYRVQYCNVSAGGSFSGTFVDIVRPLTAELDQSAYGSSSTQTFVDDFTLAGAPPVGGSRYYRIRLTQ
jgi:hypothetical protein